jgi:hypothetical protein
MRAKIERLFEEIKRTHGCPDRSRLPWIQSCQDRWDRARGITTTWMATLTQAAVASRLGSDSLLMMEKVSANKDRGRPR